MTVSLVPVEVQAPDPGEDHQDCLICTTSRPPTNAYRPHALDDNCWCTRDGDGTIVLRECWVARTYQV